MPYNKQNRNEKKSWELYEGLYLHVPFCRQKCLYCDFTSYAGFSEKIMERYTDAVCREIVLRAEENQFMAPKASIYFGGGTPSVLPTECLRKITNTLKKYAFWQQPCEATIEVNPGTADLEKLTALRDIGFNRISFGVQSLQDNELKAIGRIHNADQALEAVDMAKQAGFQRISCDLIYGLPQQTMTSLRDTLERLTATGIEHISVYGLIVEEETPLASLVDKGKIVLPDEDTNADMYELVQDFLQKVGFQRYEISNYTKNNQYSRHNTVYWQYHPYIAFGAAACGFDGQARRTAVGDVAAYIDGVAELTEVSWSGSALYTIEELSNEEHLAEFMFMGLRRCAGADLAEAEARFGVDVMQSFGADLKFYLQEGYLVYDVTKARLRLTTKGMEIGNRIFEIFVTD